MSLTLEPVPPSQTITWPALQDGPAVDDLVRPDVLVQAVTSMLIIMTAVGCKFVK
jgi:hypothetical protein